jgi:hypothetical protein
LASFRRDCCGGLQQSRRICIISGSNSTAVQANKYHDAGPSRWSRRFPFPFREVAMRLIVSTIAAGLILVAASRADEQADLQKIIDKAIKAHGLDKSPKHKASTFKIKGVVHTNGMDIDFTGEYQTQEPDKVRTVTTVTVMGNEIMFTSVFNGDKGWIQVMGNTQEMDKDAIAAAKEDLYAGKVTDLTTLKEKGYKLASLAEKKIGDRATVGVSVSHEGHKDIFLFFDKETGMLLASERQARDAMSGQEYKQETQYTDYKEVDGAKRAFRVNVKRDGEKFFEGEMTEYKTLDKLDDSVFAKP